MISLTLEFFKSQDKTKRERKFHLMKQFNFNFQNSNFILNFTQICLKIPHNRLAVSFAKIFPPKVTRLWH
jgi:hypothetical protein